MIKRTKQERIRRMTKYLDNKAKVMMNDKELKEVIMIMIKMDIEKVQKTNLATMEIEYRFVVWLIIINILKERKITDFNWNLLCEIYNENFLELLTSNLEMIDDAELKDAAYRIIDNYRIGKKAIGWILYYEFIIGIYRRLYQSHYVDKYKNIREITLYKELLGKPNVFRISNLEGDYNEKQFIRKYITSNYPLNSEFQNIIQKKNYNFYYKDYRIVQFNFTNYNDFIKNIMCKYLDKISNLTQFSHNNIKIFLYFFNKSINNIEIISYNSFSEKTFLTQYIFFNNLYECYISKKIIKNRRDNPTNFVLEFYRFLIEIKDEYSTVGIFDKAFETFLSRVACNNALKGGFKPIFHSISEEPPSYLKFCIIANNKNNYSTESNNNRSVKIDMMQINEKYRQGALEFIWYSSESIMQISQHFDKLREFLEYKKNYDDRMNNIINCKDIKYKEFAEDFLLEYRTYIENKYEKGNSLTTVIKTIRKYLLYYFEKYNVSDNDLDILNYYGLASYKGGKVITDNDLVVIYNEFVKNQNISNKLRLYTIVFEIFIYSNLRFGEIVNLKLNCLDFDKCDKDTAILIYLSKTSNKEFIQQTINKRLILLISEAIKINEKFCKDYDDNEYIFMVSTKRKTLNKNSRINFYDYFKKIIDNVSELLEVKDYVPYNIRHTFIDNAYRVGLENGLAIIEIAGIVGNTYKTAVRHYRDYDNIDNYVEAMAKVTISNVDINGKIMFEDNKYEYNIVKKNLGKCGEKGCTFNIAECLICPKFVTFINRIPAFENTILFYNEQLLKIQNKLQIKEINIQKQLLAKYLSEMYKIEIRDGV